MSFGIGRICIPIPAPILQYVPILAPPAPSATPNPWKDAAFVGIIQKQNEQYFLVGTDTQAIRLEAPASVALAKLIGKKVLASGKYDMSLMLLKVDAASDLEIISGSQPVPTLQPTPQATASAEPSL